MLEQWKSLKGIVENGDYYEVSNLGNVRSIDRKIELEYGVKNQKGKVLKQSIKGGQGYLTVGLHKQGTAKQYLVHRLIALAFIPNTCCNMVVNHIDGDKQNNCIENLEWVTQRENVRHAWEIGLVSDETKEKWSEASKGERNPNAKLTEEQVGIIKRLLRGDKLIQREIAVIFDVSPMLVSQINMGRAWKHIT